MANRRRGTHSLPEELRTTAKLSTKKVRFFYLFAPYTQRPLWKFWILNMFSGNGFVNNTFIINNVMVADYGLF